MLLVARADSSFPLSALLQPIHLPWSLDGVWIGAGCGSPFVTSTDGTNNMIVWMVGTGRQQPG